jgi:hypothetical protein
LLIAVIYQWLTRSNRWAGGCQTTDSAGRIVLAIPRLTTAGAELLLKRCSWRRGVDGEANRGRQEAEALAFLALKRSLKTQ